MALFTICVLVSVILYLAIGCVVANKCEKVLYRDLSEHIKERCFLDNVYTWPFGLFFLLCECWPQTRTAKLLEKIFNLPLIFRRGRH